LPHREERRRSVSALSVVAQQALLRKIKLPARPRDWIPQSSRSRDPLMKSLHDDPHWKAFLRKMKLPE